MRSALPALLGEHDFAPFTVCLAEQAGTQAVVYGAALRRRGATLEFEIESNRFLRRMVRALTGALVDIGRGRLEPDLFRRVLDGGEPAPPFPMAPPQGLYLVAVTYEDGPVGEARSARRRR
jgi:tRNA pseudouridine38-40 synthase